jgi:non-homologous end joining protein Ku
VDEYSVRVNELVAAKESGAPVTVREEQAAEEEISDLLAALEASVARHPAGRKRAKKGVA